MYSDPEKDLWARVAAYAARRSNISRIAGTNGSKAITSLKCSVRNVSTRGSQKTAWAFRSMPFFISAADENPPPKAD